MKNQSKGNIQIGRFKARLTVDFSWGHWPPFLWIKYNNKSSSKKNRKVFSFNRKISRFKEMKKLISFVLGLLLCFGPLSLQAQEVEMMPQEEIVEAPVLEPITEKQLNDIFGEEMYLGTLDLRGNKVDTKRDYSKKKKK